VSDTEGYSNPGQILAARVVRNRTWAGLIATPPVHVAPTAELLARVPEVS
jgi:hypothetical protein